MIVINISDFAVKSIMPLRILTDFQFKCIEFKSPIKAKDFPFKIKL